MFHIFNSLTQDKYNELKESGKLDDDALYFTENTEEENKINEMDNLEFGPIGLTKEMLEGK